MKDSTVFVIGTKLDLKGLERDYKKLLNKLKEYENYFKSKKISPLGKLDTGAIENFAQKVDVLNTNLNKIKDHPKTVNSLNKQLKGTSNTLGDVGRRVFVWGTLSAAIFGAIQRAKEFLDTVIEIDSAMAELKKVLPKETDFAFLKEQAFRFAVEFGQDPKDVIYILRRFGQAGLSAADSLKATRSALLGLNTTGAETEQMLNALIAVNRIFNISFDNTARIIDKLQKIQASYAVDAKDLVVSITGIGPVVKTLGGDINDLFGMIAGLAEAARISGKEAANSLKRTFSRIVTREGIKALQDLGVAVMATTDTYRPLFEILNDLDKALETATQVQKQNIAVTLAQVRQFPKFLAMLQNWKRVQQAVNDSLSAFGEASQANAIVMQTYEKRIAVANARMTEFFDTFYRENLLEMKTMIKETFGLFATLLKEIPSGVRQFAFTLISAIAAYKGLKAAVIGFHAAHKAAFGSYSILSLIRYNEAVRESAQLHGVAFSNTKRFSLALGAIGIAAWVIGPAMYSAYKRIKQFDDSIREAAKNFVEYEKSLKDLDIKGVFETDVESKFQKLIDGLVNYKKSVDEGATSTDAFYEAFNSVFGGPNSLKDFSKLTTEELRKIKEAFLGLENVLTNVFMEPYNKEVIKLKKNIKDTFSDLVKSFDDYGESFDAISKKILENYKKVGTEKIYLTGDSFVGIPVGSRLLTNVLLNTEEIFRKFREKVNAEASNVLSEGMWNNLVNIFRNLIHTIGGESLIDVIIGDDEAIRKVNEEFLVNISLIKEYQDALTNLRKGSKEYINTQEEISKLSKKTAADIAALINLPAMFATVASKLGIEFNKELGNLSAIGRAGKALEPVYKELIKLVDEYAKTAAKALKLNKAQVTELTNAIKDILSSLDFEQISKLKTVMAEISPVSILSGVKKTIDSTIAGYYAQIDVIEKVSKAMQSSGASYDEYENKIRATNNAINDLISKMDANAAQYAILLAEQKSLNNALSAVPKVKGFGLFEEGKDFREQLDKVNARIESLGRTIDHNNKKLAESLSLLIYNKNELEKAHAIYKLQGKALENNNKIVKNIIKGAIEYNKKIFGSPIESFRINESLYKSIEELEISLIDKMKERGRISEVTAFKKKAEIKYAYEIEKINRLINEVFKYNLNLHKESVNAAKDYLKGWLDIKNTAISAEMSINKLLVGNVDFNKILNIELKAIKERRKASIEELSQRAKLTNMSKEQVDLELASIDLIAKKEEAIARINNIMEKNRKIYSQIESEVQGIKDVIIDWLSDQSALIDDLKERGSLFRIFGRLAGGVAKVMAENDAKIIAESLTGNIKRFVEQVRLGIKGGIFDGGQEIAKQLSIELDNVTLPEDISNRIISSGKVFVDSIDKAFNLFINKAKQFGIDVGDGFLERLKNQDIIKVPEVPETVLKKDLGITGELSEKFFITWFTEIANSLQFIGDTIYRWPNPMIISSDIVRTLKEQDERNVLINKETSSQIIRTKEGGAKGERFVDFDQLINNIETIKSNNIELKNNSDALGELSGRLKEYEKSILNNIKTYDINTDGFNESIDKSLQSIDEFSNSLKIGNKGIESSVNVFNSTLRLAAYQLSNVIGQLLAKSRGVSSEAATMGGDIGGIIGTAVTGGSPYGYMIGGFLGSMFGGLFGPKEDTQEEQLNELIKIKENTTKLVDQLSPGLFNVPSDFSLPASYGRITVNNTFNIQSDNVESVVEQLEEQLNDLYSRGPKKHSILG